MVAFLQHHFNCGRHCDQVIILCALELITKMLVRIKLKLAVVQVVLFDTGGAELLNLEILLRFPILRLILFSFQIIFLIIDFLLLLSLSFSLLRSHYLI